MPDIGEAIDLRKFEFLQPFVQGWLGKIALARVAKQHFNDVGRECQTFFGGSSREFWDPKFIKKYVKGGLDPRFKMVMAKAFEFVALMGPSLYWKNPQREVRPRRMFELAEEDIQYLPDPMLQQMVSMVLQQQQQGRALDEIVAWMVETYLNYTPTEQPYGGLSGASLLATNEAMVKGRGCVWTETFSMPGSGRTLTGSFFGTVDELLIDPDAESLETAQWIVRERSAPHWELEEKFKWPAGSLRHAGSFESASYQGAALGSEGAMLERKQGLSQDYVTYCEIFSKCGPGTRLSGVYSPLSTHLDQTVGKYAYLVVTPAVPCPLNVRTDRLRGTGMSPGATDDEVKRMFQWPLPTWTDDRWPVSAIDFYPEPRKAWPIAPMGPGLGELVFLNIFSSHMANRTWSSTRDFWVVMERAADRIEEVIKGADDQAIIKLKEAHGKIEDVLQQVKQEPANLDSWRILDMMGERFADRVGLSEVWYAKNPGGRMPRTATDVESRKDFATIRTEFMGTQVESWQENIARNEMLAMRWSVKAKDLDGLFGPAEMLLYERLIEGAPVEKVVRELRATITAGSARKNNRERDSQNINATVATLLPVLTEYAAATGDSKPANAYIKLWLKSIEMDADINLGDWMPQPPPGAEQQAQLEQQQMQGELQGQQMDLEGKQIDQETKQIQAEAAKQKLIMDMQKAILDLQVKREQGQIDLEMKQQQGQLQLQQQRQQHLLGMAQTHQQGQQKLTQQSAEGKAKVSIMRQQAKAKPKPAARGKAKSTSRR